MTKEEMIAAVQECAAKLGQAPSQAQFRKMTGATVNHIRKTFGVYTKIILAAGLEHRGSGYLVSLEALFQDWAQIVRRLGKIPTMADYELEAQYSLRPLVRRFGSWSYVPAGLLDYARKHGLEGEWEDVMKIIAEHLRPEAGRSRTSRTATSMTSKPKLSADQPVYGKPLFHSPLTYAPTNEAGVVLLFGSMARQLGFAIMRVQAEFPDCEAMREVERNRWQRVRIEFEYESRNFLAHMHSASECDLIVCWSHNWPECPLEVLELQNVSLPA